LFEKSISNRRRASRGLPNWAAEAFHCCFRTGARCVAFRPKATTLFLRIVSGMELAGDGVVSESRGQWRQAQRCSDHIRIFEPSALSGLKPELPLLQDGFPPSRE